MESFPAIERVLQLRRGSKAQSPKRREEKPRPAPSPGVVSTVRPPSPSPIVSVAGQKQQPIPRPALDVFHEVDELAMGIDADVRKYTALAEHIFEGGVLAFDTLFSTADSNSLFKVTDSALGPHGVTTNALSKKPKAYLLSPNKTGAFYREKRASTMLQAWVRMLVLQQQISDHCGGKRQWHYARNMHARYMQAECLRALELNAKHRQLIRAHWQSKFRLDPGDQDAAAGITMMGSHRGDGSGAGSVWIEQYQSMMRRFDRDGWCSREGTMVMARQHCEWRRKAAVLCCWCRHLAYGGQV
jgi:hypothetical protein